MKKMAVLLFLLIFIIGSISFIPIEISKIVNAQEKTRNLNDLEMDMNLSEVSEASFLGEYANDFSGSDISGAGDVNGDGFDDILIGAVGNDEFGRGAGQVYLIFGKGAGWEMDMNLSYADASFHGVQAFQDVGKACAAGDVNNDGYDDILVGVRQNDENGHQSGKSYLILGKPSGWTKGTNLSKADGSFFGEFTGDNSGDSISSAGDVNGDGYDDILIGAGGNDEGGDSSGQTYLFFGKEKGWKMDVNLSSADASFWGEKVGDGVGSISGMGDINGDGYDDILIGSMRNDEVGKSAGQVYLILGKRTGWKKDESLANADASFIGEHREDELGKLSKIGDVNGDGYDDILMSAWHNDQGGSASGKTYLIFGKSSGWKMDTNLSNVDASFIGEVAQDRSGFCISGAGDVNMDGFDDFIIGSPVNGELNPNAGQTYLILGKTIGWERNISLSKADASFIGEYKGDWSGWGIFRAGDVNNDGFDDILIGAWYNDEGGEKAGQTYLVMGGGHTEPLEIYSVKAYLNPQFTTQIDVADFGDRLFIEVIGMDGNDSNVDRCSVMLASNITYIGPTVLLKETGLNTGIYRGEYIVNPIHFTYLEKIVISSKVNPSVAAEVLIHTPIKIRPRMESFSWSEDVYIEFGFWNFGYSQIEKWEVGTNSNWLHWEEENLAFYGTPTNIDVGSCWVNLSAKDQNGTTDFINFTIDVINTPPQLSTIEELHTKEDILFEYDLDCDDEVHGGVTWEISPSNIEWLELDSETGFLSGIPLNIDVRTYDLNITAEDAHGGVGWSNVKLIVSGVNDPPIITTDPTLSISQDVNYYIQFYAKDEDDLNIFEWTLNTDAQFLDMNNQTGVLSGVPGNDDVGTYFVNVTAQDLRGEEDSLDYTLEVIDVNDAPTWSSVPSDSQIDQGKEYTFTVEAIDIDVGDSVSFSISSTLSSDISIDDISGEIHWIATTEGLIPNPNYVLNVDISATDGDEIVTHGFTITVIPNPSPTSTILGPEDVKRVTSEGILLEWEGTDDGEEPLKYDIYLGDSHTSVLMLEKNVLWKEDFEGTSINTGKLERGKTYYWTVIPKDIYSSGICTNDVFSFIVNIPPSIQDYAVPEAKIGVEFRLTLMGSDLNNDDLEFSIVQGPTGMEIFNGMITWMPAESQVGTHTINVSLSDGYETIYTEFDVTVAEEEIIDEPDEKGSPMVLIIIIIVVILILAGAGVGLFLYLKKKGEEEPTEETTDKIPPEDTGPPEEEKQAYNQLYGSN